MMLGVTTNEGKTPEVYDEVWMMRTLIELLQQAKSVSEPDFAACAKLADLILKAQPKAQKPPSARVLEMLRGQEK
jgi:hypothetical protein